MGKCGPCRHKSWTRSPLQSNVGCFSAPLRVLSETAGTFPEHNNQSHHRKRWKHLYCGSVLRLDIHSFIFGSRVFVPITVQPNRRRPAFHPSCWSPGSIKCRARSCSHSSSEAYSKQWPNLMVPMMPRRRFFRRPVGPGVSIMAMSWFSYITGSWYPRVSTVFCPDKRQRDHGYWQWNPNFGIPDKRTNLPPSTPLHLNVQ